jgi:hypothetical protein
MVYALHKLCHYLLGNKFIFYVDHMALLYLVQKPQVSGRIARRLLLFLEYDFSVIYKPGKSYFVVIPYPECLISQRKMKYRTKQWITHFSSYN